MDGQCVGSSALSPLSSSPHHNHKMDCGTHKVLATSLFGIRFDAPPNSARIKAKRVGPKMVNPMVFLCSVLCFFSHFQSAVPSTWSEWRASGGGAVVSGVKLTHRDRIAVEGRAETDQSLITTLEMKGHPLVVNQSTP